MIVEFRLPDLGEGIAEGEVVRWLVQEGDMVQEDQPLVEVQTDKATVEIPSPVSGRVLQRMAREGDIVPVGAVLITLEAQGASQDADGAGGTTAAAQSTVTAEVGPSGMVSSGLAPYGASADAGGAAGRRRVLAAPAVRKLARELGIDLTQVIGSGPGGRVMKADVERAAAGTAALPHGPAASPSEPGFAAAGTVGSVAESEAAEETSRGRPPEDAVERLPLRGIRRAMAKRMAVSVHTAAHCTAMSEVDVTELVALRRQMAAQAAEKGVKLTYLPFLIKAVISGLKKYPVLNAALDDEREEVVIKRMYHIGIAVDTPDGLVVPVIHDADRLSLLQLAEAVQRLAERARAGRLRPEDVQGGTFTISNIGALGGTFATPIINHPEVAILGVNRIQAKPVVRDEQIVIRQILGLSLSFDHRVIDGATAARFAAHVARYLESPSLLFMEMV